MHHGEKQALISSRQFYNRRTMVDQKFTQPTNAAFSQETFQFRDVRGMCYILGLRAIHPAELNPTFLRAPSRFLERGRIPSMHPVASVGVVAVSVRPVILAVYHDYTRKAAVRYVGLAMGATYRPWRFYARR